MNKTIKRIYDGKEVAKCKHGFPVEDCYECD
jgi:hypothetical protein